MKKKVVASAVFGIVISLLLAVPVFADVSDQVISRWTKERYMTNVEGANLTISATYYSTEYIEAVMQSEAKKNMWTQSELDDYKYNYLKALRLNEMIPIDIKFVNNGPSLYLGPFDNMVSLKIGKNKYKPVDYDKRFNFHFQGQKEGLVFFPRYDQKTGKDLLKDVKSVELDFLSVVTAQMDLSSPISFMWNIANDNPQKLYQGKAAAQFETDRLLQRLDKLKKDEATLQTQLKSVEDEKNTIQKRLDELAKQ